MSQLAISQARARELFMYNPHTGRLHSRKTGAQVGHIRPNGHYIVALKNEHDDGCPGYMGGLLVWIYHNGDAPAEGQHFHIDGDSSNTKIQNLGFGLKGQVTTAHYSNNKTGVNGIYQDGQSKKYKVTPRIDGIRHYCGAFDTLDEAKVALKAYYAAFGLPLF